MLFLIQVESAASTYNGKCSSCVLANSSYYYCTKTNVCTDTYVDYNSCEQGINTCLSYKSTDLGVLEIPPFNKTLQTLNQTLTDGSSLKFAVSNQDSKLKSWIEVQIYSSDSSTVYDSAPSSLVMYYYDQVNGNLTSYVFAKTGKTYLKPLNTRFFYVTANSGEFTLFVQYGNTSKWAQVRQVAVLLLSVFALLAFVI